MAAFGHNPGHAYASLFKGGFIGTFEIASTLARAAPILLAALTFTIGVRARMLNLGMEGQAYFGAVGAVVIGGVLTLPPVLHIVVTMAVAMVFGALWALPAALLKVWRGVNEILSTLMLNYVALFITTLITVNHLTGPGTGDRSVKIRESARFSELVEFSGLTYAIVIAAAACVLVYLYLWRTKPGFALRLTGTSPDAARYAGINAKRIVLLSLIGGGLFAGLGGALQIIGRPPLWVLRVDMLNVLNLGWNGVAVALIGRSHPLGVIPAGIFFAGLLSGAKIMQLEAGVAVELVSAVRGIIVVALAIPGIIALVRWRFKR